jgi:hypothetical protein
MIVALIMMTYFKIRTKNYTEFKAINIIFTKEKIIKIIILSSIAISFCQFFINPAISPFFLILYAVFLTISLFHF